MPLNHNISATDLYSIFDLFDSKRSTGEQDILSMLLDLRLLLMVIAYFVIHKLEKE